MANACLVGVSSAQSKKSWWGGKRKGIANVCVSELGAEPSSPLPNVASRYAARDVTRRWPRRVIDELRWRSMVVGFGGWVGGSGILWWLIMRGR